MCLCRCKDSWLFQSSWKELRHLCYFEGAEKLEQSSNPPAALIYRGIHTILRNLLVAIRCHAALISGSLEVIARAATLERNGKAGNRKWLKRLLIIRAFDSVCRFLTYVSHNIIKSPPRWMLLPTQFWWTQIILSREVTFIIFFIKAQ